MSKYVKGLLQSEMERRFSGVEEFVIVSMVGVDGNENNEMRGVLKEKGIKLTTIKNSVMRRSLEKLNLAAAASLFMAGPCTMAYGGDSVVDVAKELSDWRKKVKALEFRGAFVDGDVLDADGTKALAKMPSRAELQGTIVLLANSPGANIAGAIVGPGGVIAGCIKSLVEKLEEAA